MGNNGCETTREKGSDGDSGIAILLVIAAIISLVLSFVGTVLVGALRLIPVVFAALAIAVFIRWYRDRQ